MYRVKEKCLKEMTKPRDLDEICDRENTNTKHSKSDSRPDQCNIPGKIGKVDITILENKKKGNIIAVFRVMKGLCRIDRVCFFYG